MLKRYNFIKLLSLLLVLTGFTVGIAIKELSKENVKNEVENNIIISADHLSFLEGYTKVYTFEGRDAAIYVKNNAEFTRIVPEQEVKIEGLGECNIISSSEGEFTVKTDTPEMIIGGMSGQRVYSLSGKELGFIIELNGGNLRCLTTD